jgi:hypothetical protein
VIPRGASVARAYARPGSGEQHRLLRLLKGKAGIFLEPQTRPLCLERAGVQRQVDHARQVAAISRSSNLCLRVSARWIVPRSHLAWLDLAGRDFSPDSRMELGP